MKNSVRVCCAVAFVFALFLPTLAQQKLLSVDDIYDPVKRVNFSGTPTTLRWLKDGKHYLLTNEASRTDVPRLQKVDAATGMAEPFFDSAKMQAALRGVGLSEKDAKELANRGSYQFNSNDTAILLNSNNDLFYYQLGTG